MTRIVKNMKKIQANLRGILMRAIVYLSLSHAKKDVICRDECCKIPQSPSSLSHHLVNVTEFIITWNFTPSSVIKLGFTSNPTIDQSNSFKSNSSRRKEFSGSWDCWNLQHTKWRYHWKQLNWEEKGTIGPKIPTNFWDENFTHMKGN